MGLELKERFTALMYELLEPLCPLNGLAYVLRRHPTGSYFPFAALYKKKPLLMSSPGGIPFYLLPFRLSDDFKERDQETLRQNAPLSTLVRRGRLESLHLKAPVVQHVCASNKPASGDPEVLLVVSANAGEILGSEVLSPMIAAVSESILSIWTDVSKETFKLQTFKSLSEIVSAFTVQVCDESPEPIYFPLLNINVTVESQGQIEEKSGINSLTYNCMLSQQSGSLSYLTSMPTKGALLEAYRDDLKEHEDFLSYPGPVQFAAEKTVDWVVRLHPQCLLFARHNRPRSNATTINASPQAGEMRDSWNQLRRGLQYLSDPRRFSEDVLTTVWGFDHGTTTPIFVGLRPGGRQEILPVTESEGERDKYQLGVFSVPSGVLKDRLQDQLEELSNEVIECARRLDPMRNAEEVWLKYAKEAHDLMPGEAACLHDIYSSGSRWSEGLRNHSEKIQSVVGGCISQVVGPFYSDFNSMSECTCEANWNRCWCLHALWCLRKNLLHTGMIRWLGGYALDEDIEQIRYYIWPSKEPPEDQSWPVQILTRLAVLRSDGGLKKLELIVANGLAEMTGTFSVKNPDKWAAAVMKETPPQDKGRHATARAFAFFHQYAEKVEIGYIRRWEGFYEATAKVAFFAHSIQ